MVVHLPGLLDTTTRRRLIPSPHDEEWGEGKREGIPISRANSMEGALSQEG